MSRPIREARIDLTAVARNVATIRDATAPAATMAVVKADAYGHGAASIARAAVEAGAEWLGLATLDEALALRAAGIRAPMLAWLHGSDTDFGAALEAGIDIGVSSLEQVERAAAASSSASGPAFVHIKVDTGLSRNGVDERDCEELFARAADLEREGRLRVRGVFSHLANAEETDDREQLRRFDGVLVAATAAGLTPELRHIAATAGALRYPEARYDLVRVGIGLYGLSPFDDATTAGAEVAARLSPVMELSAEIASVKRIPAGSGVSYGYTYRAQSETTVALVPIGYADGVPRQASSRAPVQINGRRYTVSGRIAMDQFVVDVGDDEVRVGDRAILFGDAADGAPTADDWADAADTINYEIVTRIGPRVTRTFLS